MTDLVTHLEKSGLVQHDQLEAVNRRRSIYGGSFDTVLLELQFLDPLDLDQQLARASELPPVPLELL